MTGPLSGIRILDLTTMVSGPISTMLLADQGAEVIKIEAPGGDYMRRVGVKHRGMSSSFLTCNRGKRSVCLDIKHPEGSKIIRKLVASSDDIEAIARDDEADVPALRGWRRELYGADALGLKHGRLAITANGSALRVIELDR